MEFDNLPPSCPPAEAFVPENMTVFRLVTDMVFTPNDYSPYAMLYPQKKFSDPCQAGGLSVFDDIREAKIALKLPGPRKLNLSHVAMCHLNDSSGRVMQTGRCSHHFTWWVARSFDISKVISPVSSGGEADV